MHGALRNRKGKKDNYISDRIGDRVLFLLLFKRTQILSHLLLGVNEDTDVVSMRLKKKNGDLQTFHSKSEK